MRRSFYSKLISALLTAGLVTAAGCRKVDKISNSDGIVANVVITALDGNEQRVTQKLDLPAPLRFKIVDRSGSPVIGASVQFCMVDISSVSDLPVPSAGEALASCAVGKLFHYDEAKLKYEADQGITALSVVRPEEVVGLVLQNQAVSDEQGMVWVQMAAPPRFDARIAVVASIDSIASIMHYTTTKFGDASQIVLQTSRNNKESAGSPFDLVLRAVDQFGNSVTSFTDTFTVEITGEVGQSWARNPSRLPEGPVECMMTGGQCLIPGGPFWISPAGDFVLKAKVQEDRHIVTDAKIVNELGPASAIAITDRLGGPAAKANIHGNVILEQGQKVKFAAAFVDAGGNYLEDSDAVWAVSNELLADSLPKSKQTWFDFSSSKTSSGNLTAQSGAAVSQQVPITIKPGAHSSWRVTTANKQIETAGECFNVKIEAIDDKENIVEDVNGTWSMALNLGGILKSGPSVLFEAHWDLNGIDVGGSTNVSVDFVKGVGNSPVKACLFDATDVSPKIEVSALAVGTATATTITGEAPIQVKVGPANRLILGTQPFGANGDLACDALTYSDNAKKCVKITTDTPQVLYVIASDKAGNQIKQSNATWTVSGPLAASLNGTSSTSSGVLLSATTIGTGVLNLLSPEGYAGGVSYQVSHGAPRRFTLASEHANTESTDAGFKVKVDAFDLYLNPCTTFTGPVNLRFDLLNALNSPAPVNALPVITFTESVNFVDGAAVTSGTLLAKYATVQPGVVSPTKPHIELTAPDNAKFQSGLLTILPGTPSYVVPRTALDGLGLPIVAPISYQSNVSILINVAGYDQYGNFVRNETANFTAGGVLDGTLQNPTGSATTLVTTATGNDGIVTIDPVTPGIPTITITPISVTSSTATSFRITTTNNQSEPAGSFFQITITARDKDNNTSASYEGPKSLFFTHASTVSWGGVQSILPDGNYTCTFVAGVCTLHDGMGTPLNFMVADSRNQHFVTVTDVGGEIPDIWAKNITAVINAASGIKIADKLGGPAAGANVMITDLVITADDTQKFAAAFVDLGGNYVSDVPGSATWTSPVPALVNYLDSTTGAEVTLNATTTGSGKYTATSGAFSGQSPQITVRPGVLAKAVMLTQNNNVEVAGVPFTVKIKVTDADGNAIDTYDRTVGTWMQWQDYESGPDVVTPAEASWMLDPTTWQDSSSFLPDAYWEILGFVDGVATVTRHALLADATATSPRLFLSLEAVEGFPQLDVTTPPISVNIGPAHHVAFMRNAAQGNFYCKRSNYKLNQSPFAGAGPAQWGGTGNAAAWFDYPVCEVIDGGISDQIHAQVQDKMGNFIATVQGDWSFVPWTCPVPSSSFKCVNPDQIGLLNGTLTNSSGTSAVTINTTYPTYNVNSNGQAVPVPALLRFVVTSGPYTGMTSYAAIVIDAGPVADFQVSGGLDVYADSAFVPTIRLVDANGSLSGYDVGNAGMDYGRWASNLAAVAGPSRSVTLAWNGPVPASSRIGTLPALVSGSTAFLGGESNTTTGYSVLMPRAETSAQVDITVSGLGTKTVTYTSKPGSPKTYRILNTPTQVGVPVTSPATVSADVAVEYYATLWDQEQNYVGLHGTAWSGTGVVDGNLLGTGSSVVLFNPQTTGAGTLTATPVPSKVGTPAVTLFAQTINPLNVVSGAHSGFEIITQNASAEAAGVAFTVSIRAIDQKGNTVTSYDGAKTIYWRLDDMNPNREGLLGTFNGVSFLTANSSSLTFVNGVVTPAPTVVLYNSSTVPSLQVSTVNTFATMVGSTTPITVSAGSFHHYGAFVSPAQSVYEPRCDAATKFDALLESRDFYGNPVPGGESNATVTMVRENGTAAVGILGGVVTGLDMSDGVEFISNLSWTAAGRFRLKVDTTGYTTPVGLGTAASTVIVADPTLNTVCGYAVDPIGSTFRAGENFILTVKAIDASGTKVTGIDDLLSALTFSWSGPSSAPNGTNPIMPTSMGFGSGQATIALTLFKAETLAQGSFVLQDNYTPAHSGAVSTAIPVQYGALTRYNVVPTQTTTTADNDGRFDVTIYSLDPYDNPRPGEASIDLRSQRVSGLINAGGLVSNDIDNLNMGSVTSRTITNVWYAVPHQWRFVMVDGDPLVTVTSPVMTSTATNKTVDRYEVQNPNNVTAGTPVMFDVRALDRVGNTLPMLDAHLNSLTFAWTGALTSPGGNVPIIQSPATRFVNGVASVTATFFAAQIFGSEELRLTDNFVPARNNNTWYSGGSNSMTVWPKAANALVVAPKSPATTNAVAGTPFDITVTAKDEYQNIDYTFAPTDLTFAWANANSSVENVTAPTVLASGTRSFPGGVFDSSAVSPNAFKLMNSFDSGVQLQVTSSLPQVNVNFTATPAVFDHVVVRTGSAHASAAAPDPINISADVSVYPLYSHGYDVYGNHRGLHAVLWEGAGSMAHPGAVTSGAQVVTNTSISPSPAGAGTIALKDGAATLATLNVNVQAGAAQRYVINIVGEPTAVAAGSDMSVYVRALDSKGNLDVNYAGAHNVSWAFVGANNSPAPANTAPVKPANGNQTFTAGELTLAGFKVHNAADSFRIQITGDLLNGTTALTEVNPAAATKYRMTTASTTPAAGDAFGVTLTAYDPWDNVDENYAASPNLTYTWANTTPSKVGSHAAEVETAGAKTFAAGVHNSTPAFKLYNKHNASVSLSVSGGLTLVAPLGFVPTNAAAIASVKIKTASANDTLYDAAVDTSSLTADQSRAFHVHAYDQFGNWHSKPAVSTWTGLNMAAGNLAPTSGVSTTFNPVTVGSASIQVDHSSFTDTVGPITVTNGAVDHFGLVFNGITPPTINAGSQFGVTVTAYDQDNNVVTSPASQAINLVWTWNGTTTGPAPDNKAPVKLSNGNRTFSSGVYTSGGTDFALFNSLDNNVTLKVEQSGAPAKSGSSAAITTITPGTATKWYATTASTTIVAGSTFPVSLVAQDTHGNTATTFTGGKSVTFTWQNAGNSLVGAVSPAVDPGSLTFAAGQVTTGSTFMLPKRTGLNYDTGSVQLQVSGEALTNYTLGTFTVNPATTSFVKVLDTNSTMSPPALELGDYTMAADAFRPLYSHAYDVYGNWISLINANWTSDGVLNGRIGGSVTNVNTVTMDPVLIGTGTVTATISSPVSNDSSGTITVNPGTAATFDVVLDVSGTIQAGTGFGATITAKDNDGNVATGFTGAKTVTWSGVGVSNAPSGQAATYPSSSQTFGAGVLTVSNAVRFYNAANDAAQLRATVSSVVGTSAALDVLPAPAQNLLVPSISAKTAGSAFNVNVTLRDLYHNASTVGCTTPVATVDCASAGTCNSPGGRGTSVLGVTSTGGPYSFNGSSVAAVNNIRLHKNGSNTIRFTTDCAGIYADASVTVNPSATPAAIYLSAVNSAPADGAHAASVNCTPGSTVTCPTMYSFAWDTWGNEINPGAWSCPSWQYVTNDTSPFNVAPYTSAVLSFASGHSTTVSNAYHINGRLRCASGVSNETTVNLTSVFRSYAWSCGNWSCSAGNPSATCTINNTSGYDIASVSYSGQAGGNSLSSNCDGALTGAGGANSCNLTVTGTTGSNSGAISPSATISGAHSSLASLTNPGPAFVQSGSVAPNCSNTFTVSSGGWACNGSDADITVTLTNNNALTGGTFGASAYSVIANTEGVAEISNTCNSVGMPASGGTCSVTFRAPGGYTPGNTFEVQFQPTDGYFQNQNYTSPGLISCP